MFVSASIVVLSACDSPGLHFRGIDAIRVEAGGSIFDVRVRGRLAEAVRVNSEYAPRFGPIRSRAAFAMARVSGCEVKEVRGDQAVATGILDCDDRPRGWVVPRAPVSYSCLEVRNWIGSESRHSYAEFECDPI